MRKRIVAVIMMLILLLCSCGEQTIDGNSENVQTLSGQRMTDEEEIRWTLKETELPKADAALVELIPEATGSPWELTLGMVGDAIYRVVVLRGEGLEIPGICVQKLEAPYKEWENFPILREEWGDNEYYYNAGIALKLDGSIDMLLQEIDVEGQFDYYMAKWTEQNGYQSEKIPNEYFTDEFLTSIKSCYVDAKDNTYFVTSVGMQYFDKTFSEKKEWTNTGDIWQIVENTATEEKPYLCGSSIDGKFCIWQTTDRNPVFSSNDVCMNYTDKVVFFSETEAFLCNTEGIWRLSMQDGKIENCLSFLEQGYAVERVYGATIKEDGTLVIMAVVDGEYLLLEKVEDKNWQNKIELEFATTYASSFLQETVVDFNKQSEDYYIVLRKPAEGESYDDFRTRIQAEVSSGGGPALLADNVIDETYAARKGLLRNLTEDFAEQKEKMLENLCAVGEVDGKSYAIPYSFSVNTLVTSVDIVGDKQCWTPEELIQYMKLCEAKVAISCYQGAALFSSLTIYSGFGGELVDWESRRSYLDSEASVSILEFAKEYGDPENWENEGVRIAEGEALSTQVTVTNLFVAQIMEALFQGKESYIGFPVKNGECGSILLGDMISINQSCEYPEGGIAFIDYLLSEKMQNQLAKDACESTGNSGGFPVYMDALENMFAYAQEETTDTHDESLLASYNGYEYVQEPLSQESMEKARRLLLSAQPIAENMDGIINIILEETPAYFSGEKSAQEVCDILQNRVQLYLDERK